MPKKPTGPPPRFVAGYVAGQIPPLHPDALSLSGDWQRMAEQHEAIVVTAQRLVDRANELADGYADAGMPSNGRWLAAVGEMMKAHRQLLEAHTLVRDLASVTPVPPEHG